MTVRQTVSVLDQPHYEMSLQLIGVKQDTTFAEIREKYDCMKAQLEKSEEISQELGCTEEEKAAQKQLIQDIKGAFTSIKHYRLQYGSPEEKMQMQDDEDDSVSPLEKALNDPDIIRKSSN